MSEFEITFVRKVLLAEIADKRMKQPDVAITYALAIKDGSFDDWETVNKAIIERWSRSGLEKIKKMAWKKLQPPAAPQSSLKGG